MTVYDATNNTLISLLRFKEALGRRVGQTHFTNEQLLTMLKVASRDIEQETRRYWVPRNVTLTLDAPPSSILSLGSGEMLPDQTDADLLTVTAYTTPLVAGTDYIAKLNKEETAVAELVRLDAGVVVQWDAGHTTDGTYRAALTVTGLRAAALDVPEEVAQATEMWAVIRWHQRSHAYLDGQGGPSEFGFNMPSEVPDIAALLARYTRYAGPQIQRVGTD